jgi:hypothetical protein
MPLHTYDSKEDKREALDESNAFFAQKSQEAKQEALGGISRKEREAADKYDFSDTARQLEDYANDPKNASKVVDHIKEAEESSGWKTDVSSNSKQEKGSFKSRVKGKKSALVAIITTLVTGAVLGTAGIQLAPQVIPQYFTNDLNDPNASQRRHAIGFWGSKPGDVQKKLSICGKTVSIRCKFNTLPVDVASQIETKNGKETGFKLIDRTEKDGRVAFSGIQFPDGQVSHNAAELNSKINSSLESGSSWNRFVYHLNNSFFNRGRFMANTLGDHDLTKKKKIEGETNDEARKSYEESTKGEKGTLSTKAEPGKPGDDATEEEKRNAAENNSNGSATSDFINGKIGLGKSIVGKLDAGFGKGPAALASTVCLMYNTANVISTGAKIIKLARYARFALIFLTLASAIAAGVATPAEVQTGMEVLIPSSYPTKVEDYDTGDQIDNPYIGLNAFDSEAFKVVAYGDQINLTGIATRLFVAGGTLGVIQTVVDWLNQHIGKKEIKTTCKILNSTAVTVISFLAAPLFSFASMAAMSILTSIVPVDEMIKAVINKAIELVAGADLTTNIIGAEAGNVIFIGTAAIMGFAAAKYGMRPGKFADIKKNMADNYKVLERETAIAKYDASKTPFDITNRYSFLGSLSFQVAQFMPSLSNNITKSASKVLSALPSSVSMLTKNAEAAYSMPVSNYSESRFSQCKDTAYADLGVAPDQFCTLRYVPFDYVDPYTTLDYMEAKKQIDMTTGNPLPNTHLEKFTKYCANREDPMGSSSVALEDEESGDGDWYTGKECMNDNEENKMASNYIGYHATQQIVDLEQAPSGGTPATAPVSGNARDMALAVAVNPNIILKPTTKEQLQRFGSGGDVYNECGAKMTVSQFLLGALLTNAPKYKITVDNIGFREDRSGTDDCKYPERQHPLGTAIDLSDIQIVGGAGTGGSIQIPGADAAILSQYATDFLFALPRNRGGVGQKNQGVTPTFPEGSVKVDGSAWFDDGPGHLHIDARNRENLRDTT